jgi:predicted ATP-dependent endonuclease of OLD family
LQKRIQDLNLDGFETLNGALSNLSQINILIGSNGSGKSSVLRLILSKSYRTGALKPADRAGNLTAPAPLEALKYRAHMIAASNRTQFELESFKKVAGIFPDVTIHENPVTTVEIQKRPNEKIETTRTTTETLVDGVSSKDISTTAPGGWRIASRIKSEIEKLAEASVKRIGTDQGVFTVLCLEEPETGLHPAIQKTFLKYLKLWLGEFKEPVQCFITR